MKNFKSLKWSFGLIATMSLGLSSCMMDDQSYQADTQRAVVVKPVAPQPRIVEKKARSTKAVVREPIQQVAPGPKRAEAPQLPVVRY